MPKYLLEARYSADGAKGVIREGGTGRREASTKAIEALGGKVESFYFAFGDVDAFLIIDLPDEKSAVAASLVVNQTGLTSVRFVPLLAPETIDAATKMLPAFRAPGT